MGNSACAISYQLRRRCETPVLILEGEHDTPHEPELYTTYLRALEREIRPLNRPQSWQSLIEKIMGTDALVPQVSESD